MKTRNEVVVGVTEIIKWWIRQRKQKLESEVNDTMSVNPFLSPFLFKFHDLANFEQLAELMIASHLMTGHNTGFGKLIDEKILPGVFGTNKLDKAFRADNNQFIESFFDEVDHLIIRTDGTRELLSLKAGRWTIQLTMAVQLNKSFHDIVTKYVGNYEKIVVGVFYGKVADLTDKYDILRGINRGANHDVIDLTNNVEVVAGRTFWSWLNDGEDATQEWVMEGILKGLEEEKIHEISKALLDKYKAGVVHKYENDVITEGQLDWMKLLRKING